MNKNFVKEYRGVTAADMPGREKMTRAANFMAFKQDQFYSKRLQGKEGDELKAELVKITEEIRFRNSKNGMRAPLCQKIK